ncbi:MAG: ribonuclease III [Persephonella sp.]|nr:MAG: ribonuclease III [Persephonella sp.]RUM61413.1 MAG: ribonuclease III [Persephonella sp.]
MNSELSPDILNRLNKFEGILGYSFKDKSLLLTALTHSSYVSEKKVNLRDYEVFEFLGDAVISLIISEILIKTFPKAKEGELSQIRSAVVSEPYLAKLGRILKLNKFILLSSGEEQQGGRERDTLICDVFEALFGAIYIDNNYSIDVPRDIFNIHFKNLVIRDIKSGNIPRDYKSILQILTQRLFGKVPEYRFVSAHGPEHKKIFTMECIINNEIKTSGEGKSKKEAETKAAKEAYIYLKEKYKDSLTNKNKHKSNNSETEKN